jgi:hypothetical protein
MQIQVYRRGFLIQEALTMRTMRIEFIGLQSYRIAEGRRKCGLFLNQGDLSPLAKDPDEVRTSFIELISESTHVENMRYHWHRPRSLLCGGLQLTKGLSLIPLKRNAQEPVVLT